MQNSFRSHLSFLQDTLLELNDSLALPLSAAERADLLERIAIVNMAVDHYRRAYQLESEIRGDNSEIALPPAITASRLRASEL